MGKVQEKWRGENTVGEAGRLNALPQPQGGGGASSQTQGGRWTSIVNNRSLSTYHLVPLHGSDPSLKKVKQLAHVCTVSKLWIALQATHVMHIILQDKRSRI